MKLSDMAINMIMKRGCISDIRNLKIDFDIPTDDPEKKPVKVTMCIEHIEVKLAEKEK